MSKTGMSRGRPKSITQVAIVASRMIPVIPSDLQEEGSKFWSRTFSHAHWLDPEADYYAVHLAAKVVDDIEIARAEIKESGRYQTLPNGASARSAAAVDLEHLHISLNSYLAALGLTPTDRARMGVVSKEELDVFAELSRRRAERGFPHVSQ